MDVRLPLPISASPLNQTNISNFLVWYDFKFAKLTETEVKTLKKPKYYNYLLCLWICLKTLLRYIDEEYTFSLSPKIILTLFGGYGHMYNCPMDDTHMV